MKRVKFPRLSKYVLIGLTLAVVNFLVYTILVHLIFKSNDFLVLSSVISCLLVTLLGYILHSRITWKGRRVTRRGRTLFFAWNFLTAFVISPLLTKLFGTMKPVYEFFYKVLNDMHIAFSYEFVESTGVFGFTTIVTTVMNYLVYDKLAFKIENEDNMIGEEEKIKGPDTIAKERKSEKGERRNSVDGKVVLDWVLKIGVAFLFALSTSWGVTSGMNWRKFLIVFGLGVLVLSLVWEKMTRPLKVAWPKAMQKWEWLVYGGITAVVLVSGMIEAYPSGTSVDVWNQYNQAVSGHYTNNHPILHTLFVFALPQLFYQSLTSTMIFQCAIIFGVLMYFCYFCRKNFLNVGGTLLALLLMTLNPMFKFMSTIPWKDVLYSWAIFLSTLLMIQIVMSEGEWLESKWHKVFFVVATLGILCFRHNGIVPFILVYLCLGIFYAKCRKFAVIAGGGLIMSFLILTVVVYPAMGVSANGGAAEVMGVMLGQIADYYHNHEQDFSAEEIAVLDGVTPLANWRENYNPASFNEIKFSHGKYHEGESYKVNDGVEKYKKELIGIWLRHSLRRPKSFLRSYLNMTSPIWEAGKGSGGVGDGLMAIVFALALVIRKAGKKICAWLPFVAVLGNTATIMLMITGGETRFVYSQILCAVPLLIYGFVYKIKWRMAK